MLQENSLTASLDSGADFYAMTVDNRRSITKHGRERDLKDALFRETASLSLCQLKAVLSGTGVQVANESHALQLGKK
jgi:hypothetical protein